MEKLLLKGITHPESIELDEGIISVGRNPTNDFRISDPTVSSFHCELLVRDNTVIVRDLNSTNGTFVDGAAVKESMLKPGQLLRLGQAELLLDALVEEPPVVRIPTIDQPVEEIATTLLDGTLACVNHPGVAAVLKCTRCGRHYCGECVRSLRLEGGHVHIFCPECSRRCEPLEPATPRKKPSLLVRLTQTIRIKLR